MISPELNPKGQIYDNLFSDIVSGIYQPRAILHEKSLMGRYGISRTPIREALIQLCSEDVLRNYPKRSYEVTETSGGNIQSIIRYRIPLECGFIQQYSGYVGDGLIEKLEHHNLYHQQHQGEGFAALGHWLSNAGFHLLLLLNHQNDYACKKLQESMTTQVRFYTRECSRQWHPPTFCGADGLHITVVDYLKRKSYSMASNVLRADIEDRVTM